MAKAKVSKKYNSFEDGFKEYLDTEVFNKPIIEVDPNRSVLPDSGLREQHPSGAFREPSTGKGRFDLIEPELLFRLAKRLEDGAHKYSPRNWEKGIPSSRCIDSAYRHLTQFMQGDNSEDHLAACIWNLGCIMRFEKDNNLEFLDLPRYEKE